MDRHGTWEVQGSFLIYCRMFSRAMSAFFNYRKSSSHIKFLTLNISGQSEPSLAEENDYGLQIRGSLAVK